MIKPVIGVLALQGDFALHAKSVKRLGLESRLIRDADTLKQCSALILPGGETTTFVKLLKKTGLFKAIQTFSKNHAIMGTCAGCISLSSNVVDEKLETLALIDIDVKRNAYGRQVDSFIDSIQISVFNGKADYEGVFIRAPVIRAVSGDTEVLGYHKDEIVMARNKNILVTTFHPELTTDNRIHRYFVQEMMNHPLSSKL